MTRAAYAAIEQDIVKIVREPRPLGETGGGLSCIHAADSDHRVAEAVRNALGASGDAALRGLEVELCQGVIILWGRVPTYYQKQLAQVTAQQVEGVQSIANGVEVVCKNRPGG